MFKFSSKILSFVAVSLIVFLPVFSSWLGPKPSNTSQRSTVIRNVQDISSHLERLSLHNSWHFIKNRQLIKPPSKFKVKLPPLIFKVLRHHLVLVSLFANDRGNIGLNYLAPSSVRHRIYLSFRKLLI